MARPASSAASDGVIPVYKVSRTFLFELLLAQWREDRIHFADSADSRRTFAQLAALECEQRPNSIIYKCPSGQHDDLAMSLAMLNWAAQHLDLDWWMRPIFDAHRPRRPGIVGAGGDYERGHQAGGHERSSH